MASHFDNSVYQFLKAGRLIFIYGEGDREEIVMHKEDGTCPWSFEDDEFDHNAYNKIEDLTEWIPAPAGSSATEQLVLRSSQIPGLTLAQRDAYDRVLWDDARHRERIWADFHKSTIQAALDRDKALEVSKRVVKGLLEKVTCNPCYQEEK